MGRRWSLSLDVESLSVAVIKRVRAVNQSAAAGQNLLDNDAMNAHSQAI